MIIFLSVVIFLLLLVIFYQYKGKLQRNKELKYIYKKLEEIMLKMDNNIIRIYEVNISQREILKNLVSKDVELEAINRKTSSLEEHFLNILGMEGE